MIYVGCGLCYERWHKCLVLVIMFIEILWMLRLFGSCILKKNRCCGQDLLTRGMDTIVISMTGLYSCWYTSFLQRRCGQSDVENGKLLEKKALSWLGG